MKKNSAYSILEGAISIVRGFLTAGIILCFSSTIYGAEMSGGSFRVTRDDVNSGGQAMTGTGLQLIGSIGPIDQTPISGGSFNVGPGLIEIYFYPRTITDLAPTPDLTDPTRLTLNWSAPAAGPNLNRPSSGYAIKWSSVTPLTDQTIFFNATDAVTIPATITPQSPGNNENITVTGLRYNTSYYISVEAQDSDQNQAYFSNSAFAYTIANIPTNLAFPGFTGNSIILGWDTNNPDGDLLQYEAVLARDAGFTTGVTTNTVSSLDPNTFSSSFLGLNAGVAYYFRVRSLNSDLPAVPSPWSVMVSTDIPVGLPGILPFSNIQLDRITANWDNGGNNDPTVEYQSERADDLSFTQNATLLPATPTSGVLSQGHTGLSPNTEYFFRVRAFSAGGVNPTPYAFLGSTITGVNSVSFGTVDAVYQSSAAFSWADPGGNGPSPYHYRMNLSTDIGFTGTLFSDTVTNPVTSSTITALTPNTTYFARLWTLNQAFSEFGPALFPSSPFATDPLPATAGNILLADDYRIQFSWTDGNPDTTRYEVQTSTDSGFGLLTASAITVANADNHMFNTPKELMANTTYYVRVRSLAHSGPVNNSRWFVIGSTVTAPTSPTIVSPIFNPLAPTSATIHWSSATVNAFNGPDTIYRVRAFDTNTGGANYDQTNNTTNLNTNFTSLLANTTYTFTIHAQGFGGWPDAGPITVSTATLALPPAAASPPFSAIGTDTITSHWLSGGNPAPPSTRYLVESATQPFPSVVDQSIVTTNLQQTFNGLSFNTSYYYRISALNHNDVPSGYLVYSATATRPVVPTISGFTTTPNSIAVTWNGNGNSPDTQYFVQDNNPPNNSAMVTGTSWTNTALGPNTEHAYSVLAMGRDGTPTAFSSTVSTWTRANRPQSITNVSSVDGVTISFRINPGNNPYGLGASPNTEFAVQVSSAIPDGLPVFSNLYFGSNSGPQTFFLDSAAPVWRTLSQWDAVNASAGFAVITATGLASGRTYEFVVYARNGDGDVLPGVPGIVTSPSPPALGRTWSGTPILALNGITAVQSFVTQVWVSTQVIPIRSAGAFHSHYEFLPGSTANAMDDLNFHNYPGWDGFTNGTIRHDANTNPDYRGPLSGFYALNEGVWVLYVYGDAYPFGAPSTSHQTVDIGAPRPAVPFRVFVDTTTPVIPNLRAQFSDVNVTPIPSGTPHPEQTPYFLWDNPDPTPSNTISPIVGYSYSYSTNPLDTPILSTATANFLPEPNRAVHMTSLQPAGTFYFRVSALDTAGNWSNPPSEFIYVSDPDLILPHVVSVDMGASVLIPQSQMSVSVSTTVAIRVTFSEDMDPFVMVQSGNMTLTRTRDHMGNSVNQNVPITVTYDIPSRVATIQSNSILQWGSKYLLRTTPAIVDLGLNSLGIPLNKEFYTLMDPMVTNIVPSETGQSVVTFPPQAWGTDFAGLAINADPVSNPMTAPSLSRLINDANSSAQKRSGGYAQPFVIQEFNLYGAIQNRMGGTFNGAVLMTMSYNDANNNGIVDETEGTQNEVLENALDMYWLDEDTGVWVRLPGSLVDTVNNTVTANLRHFSVYGLLGAPALDLSNAYAYPVPYKPAIHQNGIRFTNLSQTGTIKVYTLTGELVKTLPTDGSGLTVWNPVHNDSGSPLGSDVYLYVIENGQQKKVGKVMVVR